MEVAADVDCVCDNVRDTDPVKEDVDVLEKVRLVVMVLLVDFDCVVSARLTSWDLESVADSLSEFSGDAL